MAGALPDQWETFFAEQNILGEAAVYGTCPDGANFVLLLARKDVCVVACMR